MVLDIIAKTGSGVKSQLVYNHHLDLEHFRHYKFSYCNIKMSGAGKGKGKNRQTRFPVARIKRIMQKDEEVGKVAQATPVVICE
jgi:Histone-like transcription factor (CBF/NF-Y) and archaeal histone